MSETFAASKEAIGRLRKSLSNADEDTRWNFGFWCAGLVMMGGAVVGQFGLNGVIFCFGALVYVAGKHGMSNHEQRVGK
jgi:hypothetical protein